ncbi:MAG TPA: TlpA disulfide reductase family protein [Terriglobales bacterium]|nr:TlpA disulfide reductase family protein [Terriglobales bacterium]
MPVTKGSKAPELKLSSADGKSFSLAEESKSAPVVAAFFKVSCPTCQYAFPFIERIHKAYPKDKVKVVGVSQDDKAKTTAFAKEFGITFPVLLDDIQTYPASNAYGLVNVPSTFVITPKGQVEFSTIGWVREELEQLNKLVAETAGLPPAQIFKPGEQVQDFKAG